MPYDPEEGWEALVQEVVALWTSGQREAALLRLGGIAQHVCTTRNADDGNDAPPAWLVHDGALEELGPPARAAWLLTAFAILGESLGLVPAQVELALARARVAAAAAHTTLRHEAAAFLVDQDDRCFHLGGRHAALGRCGRDVWIGRAFSPVHPHGAG